MSRPASSCVESAACGRKQAADVAKVRDRHRRSVPRDRLFRGMVRKATLLITRDANAREGVLISNRSIPKLQAGGRRAAPRVVVEGRSKNSFDRACGRSQ